MALVVQQLLERLERPSAPSAAAGTSAGAAAAAAGTSAGEAAAAAATRGRWQSVQLTTNKPNGGDGELRTILAGCNQRATLPSHLIQYMFLRTHCCKVPWPMAAMLWSRVE